MSTKAIYPYHPHTLTYAQSVKGQDQKKTEKPIKIFHEKARMPHLHIPLPRSGNHENPPKNDLKQFFKHSLEQPKKHKSAHPNIRWMKERQLERDRKYLVEIEEVEEPQPFDIKALYSLQVHFEALLDDFKIVNGILDCFNNACSEFPLLPIETSNWTSTDLSRVKDPLDDVLDLFDR